jgi:hypothetical protein|nr:MAG TPA: hypothetical protein [Caudoviricetes sp.]
MICPIKFLNLNGKIDHNSSKRILIGKWSSAWNLSDIVKTSSLKKPRLITNTTRSTTSGASASIQAQVVASATVVDDAYVLFEAGYSYNGLSANINMGRVVFLRFVTVLTPQLKKFSTSGATSTTGNSYMEVVHIY